MLGDTLRKAREEQGLSLHDIEDGTSIRTLYIDAIERSDYAALPGAVYARGFVRNYANFLKLDADECLQQYDAETSNEPVHAEAPAPAPSKEKPAPAQRRTNGNTFSSGQNYNRPVNNSSQWQNFVLIGLTAVVILAGGWFAFGSSFDTPDSVKKEVDETTTASHKTSNHKPDTIHQTPASPQAASNNQSTHKSDNILSNSDGVSVSAQLKGRSWMSVTVDGEVVFEGIAEDGETMSWKGKNEIVISSGNAGAVDVTENGKHLGTMGGIGEVAEKTYSRNEPAARHE